MGTVLDRDDFVILDNSGITLTCPIFDILLDTAKYLLKLIKEWMIETILCKNSSIKNVLYNVSQTDTGFIIQNKEIKIEWVFGGEYSHQHVYKLTCKNKETFTCPLTSIFYYRNEKLFVLDHCTLIITPIGAFSIDSCTEDQLNMIYYCKSHDFIFNTLEHEKTLYTVVFNKNVLSFSSSNNIYRYLLENGKNILDGPISNIIENFIGNCSLYISNKHKCQIRGNVNLIDLMQNLPECKRILEFFNNCNLLILDTESLKFDYNFISLEIKSDDIILRYFLTCNSSYIDSHLLSSHIDSHLFDFSKIDNNEYASMYVCGLEIRNNLHNYNIISNDVQLSQNQYDFLHTIIPFNKTSEWIMTVGQEIYQVVNTETALCINRPIEIKMEPKPCQDECITLTSSDSTDFFLSDTIDLVENYKDIDLVIYKNIYEKIINGTRDEILVYSNNCKVKASICENSKSQYFLKLVSDDIEIHVIFAMDALYVTEIQVFSFGKWDLWTSYTNKWLSEYTLTALMSQCSDAYFEYHNTYRYIKYACKNIKNKTGVDINTDIENLIRGTRTDLIVNAKQTLDIDVLAQELDCKEYYMIDRTRAIFHNII